MNNLLVTLPFFFLFGGGFIAAFVVLVISSRMDELKNRLELVTICFCFLIGQHACYSSIDNWGTSFGNGRGHATAYVYLAYLLAGIWSLYLLRKTNTVIVLRKHIRQQSIYMAKFILKIFKMVGWAAFYIYKSVENANSRKSDAMKQQHTLYEEIHRSDKDTNKQ